MSMNNFNARYGPVALVTGSAGGIGAGYARELAARGLSLVLTDINATGLESTAAEIQTSTGRDVDTIPLDMTDRSAVETLDAATRDLDVGLVICNHLRGGGAGRFLDGDLEQFHNQLEANVRAYIDLAHHFGNRLRERGRGGIILMSSLTGVAGSPYVAMYGASKAFVLAFGSAIAYELRNTGVDVLTLVPSSVNTETYQRAEQQRSRVFPPMDVRDFVVSALDALGSRWVAVPGRRNAITADVLGRLLPRRSATSMMGRNLEKMLGAG
jgi:short-subunit dehydrogenase